MSGPYLHGHHASVLRSHSWRTVENSCPHLLPYLSNPALRILDVGCGPGTISVDLASRVPSGFVYAIDPSADVIAKARQYAVDKGITNVRFEVGDIHSWTDLPDMTERSFDVVHAHQVLQHLQDPLDAMQQMKRLTKPGGILAVRDCDYSAMSWHPEHPGLSKWKDVYIRVAYSLNAYPNMGKTLHAFAMRAGIPRADIEASIGAWVFSTPEERAWWCGLWADRTTQSDFRQRALESGCASEGELEEIAGAFRAMQHEEEGWFAVVNGQVICHIN